ncbi:hypothetical protein B5M09_000613 [Aphanomyces astaci]|uniref:Nephrocystin 3-like N-terminal domain-containing protein n=1 Tax=Aphanomyces astaci TaxID=112090 RepID=A0A425D650_APHAT|nr:hypothetical protein B5M09_000613 [Aphanomyces astaci]
MSPACDRCGKVTVVFLELRSVWLCGSCEHMFTETSNRSSNNPSSISSSLGCDWESDISEGLQRAKEAKEHGRVLLLMTPHAVRRNGGYCLNEVARAVQLGLSIFPVLVMDCEQPQSIANLPFFDLRDCIPRHHLDGGGAAVSSSGLKGYGVVGVSSTTDVWELDLESALASPRFLDKMNRIVAMLELCDSMLSYHAPLVGGVANWGKCHDPAAATTRGGTHAPATFADKASLNVEQSRYFLSYGDMCATLGRALYRDLVARGFHVHPQSQYPRKSVMAEHEEDDRLEALHWTHQLNSGKLVLFITPGSVGRPHGVCLNEISLAMTIGLNFVPLMIRQCEIPLSICRIQWLDMTDVSSFHTTPWTLHDARYSTRREQLIAALNGRVGLDQEGQQARLFRFDEWVTSPPSNARRVFLLTGVIGSGKTALAAHIIQNRPEVVAFHLASHEGEQTQNGRRCVLNLVYQLTTQLPAYANVLKYVVSTYTSLYMYVYMWRSQKEPLEETVFVGNLADLVQELLIAPLERIATPPSTMCFPCADDNLVAILTASLNRWPAWMRFVFTSREDPRVLSLLQAYMLPPIALDLACAQSKRDVRQYLDTALGSHFDISPPMPPHVIDLLVDRTQVGLFLYARHLVDSISSGQWNLDNLDNVPTTMGGFLHQNFATQFPVVDKYKGSYSIVPPHEVREGTAIFSDLVSFVESFLRQGILKEPIRHTGRLNRGISQHLM